MPVPSGNRTPRRPRRQAQSNRHSLGLYEADDRAHDGEPDDDVAGVDGEEPQRLALIDVVLRQDGRTDADAGAGPDLEAVINAAITDQFRQRERDDEADQNRPDELHHHGSRTLRLFVGDAHFLAPRFAEQHRVPKTPQGEKSERREEDGDNPVVAHDGESTPMEAPAGSPTTACLLYTSPS